jgi:ribosome-associated toxin RatA of RatAB toxin-antitoxin module
MRHVKRSALVARPAACLYALVNDVERYPEFVPGCSAARIESRGAAEIVATLAVRRGPLVTEFTTRNRLEPPAAVHMSLVSGPFRRFDGGWRFTPIGETGCRIELELTFEFAGGWTSAVFDPLFEETAAALVDAFVARARSAAACSGATG